MAPRRSVHKVAKKNPQKISDLYGTFCLILYFYGGNCTKDLRFHGLFLIIGFLT